MKILYILNVFPTISETFIVNEITGLIDLGHEIEIISLNRPKQGIIHKRIKDYDLIRRTTYLKFDSNKYSRLEIFEKATHELFENGRLTTEQKNKLLDLCYQKKQGKEIALRRFLDCLNLIKIIKEKNIEHIHCHFAKENVLMAYAISRMIGIPYTFTTHAYDIFINPNKSLKIWAQHAKKVITISEFNKRYMNEQLGINLKIEIITYSKYLDKLKPVKEYSVCPFKIISVSRFVEKKGYPYLIEACKILKQRNIAFSCEIHGYGPEKKKLEQLIGKQGLHKDVSLKGELNHEEVIEFIKKGSVFVLPCIKASNNDMDGIPNVLMESMALEIPTIATDVTGIPELIDHETNGIMVPQNDSSALADAIVKIKNDPVFAESIRKKSREKVMEKFNVEKNVKKLVEVFGK